MPLHLQVLSERWEVHAEGGGPPGGLAAFLPAFDDAKFLMLRHVDIYGDTVFNRSQCMEILEELKELEPKVNSAAAQLSFDALHQFATDVFTGTHLYLRFVGEP